MSLEAPGIAKSFRANQRGPQPMATGLSNTKDSQDRRPPLGIMLTGYRLVNMTVILAFGIQKVVSSYHGQPVTPTTVELAVGTLLAVM